MNTVIEAYDTKTAKIKIGELTTVHFRIKKSLLPNERSCILHGSVEYSGHLGVNLDKIISPEELVSIIEALKLMHSNFVVEYEDYFHKEID